MGRYEQELIREYQLEEKELKEEISELEEELAMTKEDLEVEKHSLQELEEEYDELEKEFKNMRRDYVIIKGVLEYVEKVVFKDGSECKASEIEKHFRDEVNILKIIFGGR